MGIIGGCCGTTAAHIAEMRYALDTPGDITRPLPVVRIVTREARETAVVDPPTQLAQNLAARRFVSTVEMSPPKGIAAQRLLAGAKMLKEAGANLLNIADSPLARMRMSAWAAAYLVQKEVGLETVLHFPTRGQESAAYPRGFVSRPCHGYPQLICGYGRSGAHWGFPGGDRQL